MISRSRAPLLLIVAVVVIGIVALLLPPIPQPPAYHNFADHRAWLGIPNFRGCRLQSAVRGCRHLGPHRSVGPECSEVLGCARALALRSRVRRAGPDRNRLGLLHLAPDNARLVWDRIPIMIAFMSLVAAVIAERVSLPAGLALLPLLQIAGIASVLVWRNGELHGHGDLRFYAAMQVYAILVLLLMLLVQGRHTRGGDFAVVVGLYVIAKILEESDRQVFALGHIVSGHTLKHLAAALAGYWILRMLKKRALV